MDIQRTQFTPDDYRQFGEGPDQADLQAMLEAYMACGAGNDPVAEWPL